MSKQVQQKMKRIFFIEDDLSLIKGMSFALRNQGYEVQTARTCLEAEKLWNSESCDLVILDVSLPDGSGFDLCGKIRAVSKVPILFLTAADEETDITMGLDIGGDDYITKPFKLAIFLSKVRAILRRSTELSPVREELCSGGIRVDLLKKEVYKREARIELTAGEYRLLCLFMKHPDQVLSKEQILGNLWDCKEAFIDSSTLTVYISRLRAKVEDDPANPRRIITVRRMGYKWNTAN